MTDKPTQALAAQHPPQSALSAIPQPGTSKLFDLTPATAREGNAELTACLTLVVPSGMTERDRSEWLRVARQTLSGIPADLLERGCAKARLTCRFPSEIVPTIVAATKDDWDWRKRQAAKQNVVPRLAAPEPDCVDPGEVAKLLADLERKLAA